VCHVDLEINDMTSEPVVMQPGDEPRRDLTDPLARVAGHDSASGRPRCPACGENAAAGPLFVERPGTLDMTAQYFCRHCSFSFELVSSQSLLKSRR
jgi:hypothetical protein